MSDAAREAIAVLLGLLAGGGLVLLACILAGRIDHRAWLCPRCAHDEEFSEGESK